MRVISQLLRTEIEARKEAMLNTLREICATPDSVCHGIHVSFSAVNHGGVIHGYSSDAMAKYGHTLSEAADAFYEAGFIVFIVETTMGHPFLVVRLTHTALMTEQTNQSN